jgi:drug/metabolite transporter (DMT)-like permease
MWIGLSLAAGSLQTVRNAVARQLGTRVDPALNSWARFSFTLPWAFAFLLAGRSIADFAAVPPGFWLPCLAAAWFRLLGNIALVAAFRHASFAQVVMLNKLEVVITALVGALAFSEPLDGLGWLGVVLCTWGTAAIHAKQPPWRLGVPQGRLGRGSWLALTSAGCMVVASFSVKGSVAVLYAHNPALAAVPLWLPAQTLFHVTCLQVLILSTALLWRDRRALAPVGPNLRAMAGVGAASFACSLCWYGAFATGVVAYVRALGQIEAPLSVALGLWLFRERATGAQLPGAALVLLGILLVLL